MLRSGGHWESLGGVLAAAPVAVTAPATAAGQVATTLYLGTGTDADLWVRSDRQGWRPLPSSPVHCVGNPGATVTGPVTAPVLTVACEGADGALWYSTGPVTPPALPHLDAWRSLGGILVAGPAVLPGANPTFAAVGSDSHVWVATPSGFWATTSLQCLSHPVAAVTTGLAAIACQGFDNALWWTASTGSAWSAPQRAGGIVVDALAARVTPQPSRITLDSAGTDGAAWEVPVTATAAGGWSDLGGGVTPTPEQPYTLPVPVYAQVMNLDCETAALQMALAYFGHLYSQQALFPLENPDTRPPVLGPNHTVLRWGDPYTNFVGNVNGSDTVPTGYGVYEPVIAGIARSLGVAADGAEGFTAASVYAAVGAGHPVQAWVETNWQRTWLGTWTAWDGRSVRYSLIEHSLLLTGVTATAVRVNDPIHGRQYWVPRSTFETSWADFGNMAVVYG